MSWDLELIRRRTDAAREVLACCRLCGHGCRADRLAGEKGRCGAGAEVRLAAGLLHFGEEPPISGKRGSGTVFFSGCPLSCVFCQNYQISQEGLGREVSVGELAGLMLDLEQQGAHNINLVSPTPWVPRIIEALGLARQNGLSRPVVYNTGGFDSLTALELLDGLVDIYLPDAKYADPGLGRRYSLVPDYAVVNRSAIKEMYRQVGPFRFDPDGLAVQGVLVRHLVLPANLADTGKVLGWLAAEFGSRAWISLMAQYMPCHRVLEHFTPYPELARPLSEEEYDRAMDLAWDLGLENVFVQEMEAARIYVPDFTSRDIFSV